MKVLVLEDDLDLLKAILEIFDNESFETTGVSKGDDGYFLAEQGGYDLIILDVMLPILSGLEIVKRLRKQQVLTPVIMLTAKDSVEDCVNGLDAGADDYITKPFSTSILLARARAALRRRSSGDLDGNLTCGPIVLAVSLRDAFVDEQSLKLTPKEYELFEFFLRNKDQILSRDQIFERIWGFDSDSASSAVDVYVHHLRKKLAPYEGDLFLKTIRGVGYLLKGEPHV
ncbi:response regulator transcription factor [Paenibacillus ferrarius]|uniref:response regulator transcription factor n=1 Tax=Paenibacillus ferrarius TaxID=1469647 RepID=UPI003D2B3233